MKKRLRPLVITLGVIILCLSCSFLTYFIASGAWNITVSLISNIINQGPAAIITAILSGLLAWYCLPAAFIIALFVGVLAFVYNNYYK